MEGVGVVCGPKQGRRPGEFQDEDAPPRTQHPLHGLKRAFFARNIAKTETDTNAVEGMVWERELFGVGLYVLDIGDDAIVDETLPPSLEHGGVDVPEHHEPGIADPAGHQARQIASAPGQIQYPLSTIYIAQQDRGPFPESMQPQRHEIIHEVVFVDHGVEYVGYPSGLFFQGDLPKAEMGFLRCHCFWVCGVLVATAEGVLAIFGSSGKFVGNKKRSLLNKHLIQGSCVRYAIGPHSDGIGIGGVNSLGDFIRQWMKTTGKLANQ